eukprot:1122442-Pyramimonas_sp.AAC.1
MRPLSRPMSSVVNLCWLASSPAMSSSRGSPFFLAILLLAHLLFEGSDGMLQEPGGPLARG